MYVCIDPYFVFFFVILQEMYLICRSVFLFTSSKQQIFRVKCNHDDFHAFPLDTARKMNFSIKNFLSKCDQIRMQIWSHLLRKSLVGNFSFFAVEIKIIIPF